MEKRKTISIILLIIAIGLSTAFLMKIDFPVGLDAYFKKEYYSQFGPLAIGIELIIASYYLLVAHKKANFALTLFGFTALLDPILNQIGLFSSTMPLYATIILSICGLLCLWLAFKNTFKLNPLSILAAFASFVLGSLVELFFNYL